MTVTIPDEAVLGLLESPEQARVELAAALYARGRATMGRAMKVAGLTRLEMQRELARREIPLNYGIEDWEADLRTLRGMNGQ